VSEEKERWATDVVRETPVALLAVKNRNAVKYGKVSEDTPEAHSNEAGAGEEEMRESRQRTRKPLEERISPGRSHLFSPQRERMATTGIEVQGTTKKDKEPRILRNSDEKGRD